MSVKKLQLMEVILRGLKLKDSKQARAKERIEDGIKSAIRNFSDSIESKEELIIKNLEKLGELSAEPFESSSYSNKLTTILQENIRLDAQIRADRLSIESLEAMQAKLQAEVEVEEDEKTK